MLSTLKQQDKGHSHRYLMHVLSITTLQEHVKWVAAAYPKRREFHLTSN